MDELEERDVAKENDQYCQYKKLPILLKRFSFEEKMGMPPFIPATLSSLARTSGKTVIVQECYPGALKHL